MRLGNVVAGAAFKTAALSLVLLAIMLGLAGAWIVGIVRGAMIQELREQIVEELVVLREVYDGEGRDGLIELTDRIASTQITRTKVVGLFASDGTPIAGELDKAPDFSGWGALTHMSRRSGVAGDYHVDVETIGDETVVVGRSLDIVNRVVDSLVSALALAGLVVTLVSLGIGYVASRNAFRKLEGVAATLDRVARGDMTARLAVGRANDQIDRVSRRMNTHLERLSDLTETIRNTTIAIAHDLRTPLNRAYLDIQSAAGESASAANRLDALRAAGTEMERISAIFDTILRIARIESSAGRRGFAPISLADLATEVTEAYRPVLEDKGQALSVEIPGGNTGIEGDRSMLLQMLANLVANSNRHTPAGTRVTIAVAATGEWVSLCVSDNGPGIPEERRAEALKPFRRLTTDSEGAGLGLSLVRAIAERHGTSVSLADNRPGLRVEVRFAAAADCAATARVA